MKSVFHLIYLKRINTQCKHFSCFAYQTIVLGGGDWFVVFTKDLEDDKNVTSLRFHYSETVQLWQRAEIHMNTFVNWKVGWDGVNMVDSKEKCPFQIENANPSWHLWVPPPSSSWLRHLAKSQKEMNKILLKIGMRDDDGIGHRSDDIFPNCIHDIFFFWKNSWHLSLLEEEWLPVWDFRFPSQELTQSKARTLVLCYIFNFHWSAKSRRDV